MIYYIIGGLVIIAIVTTFLKQPKSRKHKYIQMSRAELREQKNYSREQQRQDKINYYKHRNAARRSRKFK